MFNNMTYERGANMPIQHAESQGAAHEALPSFFAYESLDSVPDWGATPLGLTNDPRIQALQEERFYGQDLIQRAEQYLSGAPESITQLCGVTLEGVNHRRGIENSGSYGFRNPVESNLLEEDKKIILDIESAAIEGRATPLGLLTLQRTLDLPSIELAKTTFKGEMWPVARQNVREAMDVITQESVWVESSLDKLPRIGLTAFGNKYDEQGNIIDKELHGFTVRARKYRGVIDEQTHVREVMSMIVRTDPGSGFEEWFRESNPYIPHSISIDQLLRRKINPDLAPHETLGAYRALMDTLHTALEDDSLPFPKWIIPVTSTIYAYNPAHKKNTTKHPAENRLSEIQREREGSTTPLEIQPSTVATTGLKQSRLSPEYRQALLEEHASLVARQEISPEQRTVAHRRFVSMVMNSR